jgi:hypothetical protein
VGGVKKKKEMVFDRKKKAARTTDSTETPSIRGAHIRLSIKHMRTPRIRLDNRQPPKRHVQRALRQHGAYARSKAIK